MLRTSCQARRTIARASRLHRAIFVGKRNADEIDLSCATRARIARVAHRVFCRARRRTNAPQSCRDGRKSRLKFFLDYAGESALDAPDNEWIRANHPQQRFAWTMLRSQFETVEATENECDGVDGRSDPHRSAPYAAHHAAAGTRVGHRARSATLIRRRREAV
jgi:hypothetical protein